MIATIGQILGYLVMAAVGIVIVLGLARMTMGGDKKKSNQLMQLRVLLQFVAVILLVGSAYLLKQ